MKTLEYLEENSHNKYSSCVCCGKGRYVVVTAGGDVYRMPYGTAKKWARFLNRVGHPAWVRRYRGLIGYFIPNTPRIREYV